MKTTNPSTVQKTNPQFLQCHKKYELIWIMKLWIIKCLVLNTDRPWPAETEDKKYQKLQKLQTRSDWFSSLELKIINCHLFCLLITYLYFGLKLFCLKYNFKSNISGFSFSLLWNFCFLSGQKRNLKILLLCVMALYNAFMAQTKLINCLIKKIIIWK